MSSSLIWLISQSSSPCFHYHFLSCLSLFLLIMRRTFSTNTNMSASSFWSSPQDTTDVFSWGMTGVASSHGSVQFTTLKWWLNSLCWTALTPVCSLVRALYIWQTAFLFNHTSSRGSALFLGLISMIFIIHNEILWLGPGNHGALPSICLVHSSLEEEVVITGRLLAETRYPLIIITGTCREWHVHEYTFCFSCSFEIDLLLMISSSILIL